MLASRLARLAALSVFAFCGLTAIAAAAETATTLAHANLRQGPGTSYDIVTSVPAGTEVTVDVCTGKWCAVTTEDNDEGFVAKSLLDFDAAPEEPATAAEVCFYQQANFKGANFCVRSGDEDADIPGNFADNIESILIDGDISVEVCAEPDFGDCETYDHSVKKLPFSLRNDISSYRVDGGSPDNSGDDNSDDGDFNLSM